MNAKILVVDDSPFIRRVVCDVIEASPDFVVAGEAGGIISDGWFQREWRTARASLDLSEVHFHDLRHAAGTIATQQGATMREVMSRLGHSTTSAAIRYQNLVGDRFLQISSGAGDLVKLPPGGWINNTDPALDLDALLGRECR